MIKDCPLYNHPLEALGKLGLRLKIINLYFLCCKLLFAVNWALMHISEQTPLVW